MSTLRDRGEGERADQPSSAPELSIFAQLKGWLGEAPYNERTIRGRIYYGFYGQVWCRFVRFMHRRGFCYAPLKEDMEGWHRWCQWCGMRESYKRNLYEWNDERKSLRFRRDLKLKELTR